MSHSVILWVGGIVSLILLIDIIRFFVKIAGEGAGIFTSSLCHPLFGLLNLKMFSGFIVHLIEVAFVALYIGYLLFYTTSDYIIEEPQQEQVVATEEPAPAEAQSENPTESQQQADAAEQLKEKVAQALAPYASDGLSVEQKDGDVRISLGEDLLSSSGGYGLSSKGVEAVKKAASSLKDLGSNVEIAVEGHTDSRPQHGPVIEDNWDLSAKRATSVLRVLANEGVSASQLKAVGRADTQPVADNDTDEGRSKNRRVEIVLTPSK